MHNTWELERIQREMEKTRDRWKIPRWSSQPLAQRGFQVIHLVFDLSAFSLPVGLQVFSWNQLKRANWQG